MDSKQQHTSQSTSDIELMEQVADWLFKLESSDCTEQDKIDFELWQQQDPKHGEMIEKMQATFATFNQLKKQSISHQVVMDVVHQSQFEKIFKPFKLYTVVLICMFAFAFWQIAIQNYWFADTKIQYNVWTQQVLSDHSEIKISGQTAYNLKFDKYQRCIELLDGNVMVDVAKDAKRPFIIRTKFTDIKALGTRFIVHHSDKATILTMLHSSTEVTTRTTRGGYQRQKVDAGQQVVINDQGVIAIRKISIDLVEHAWQKHQLSIDLMPLDQVLAILQSYQKQTFKYDAQELADIEVTATLPLNGTALNLLEKSLAIEVKRDIFGRILITRQKNK